VEHVGDDAGLGALAAPRQRLPALEEGAELGDEREGAPLVVLRRAWLQTHEASREVHLRPHERQHLGALGEASSQDRPERVLVGEAGGERGEAQNFSLLQKTTIQPSRVGKFCAGTSDWWPESATRSGCQSRLRVQIAK
jgi:hypothetical protein